MADTTQIDEDIETLNAISKSYTDENEELAQTVIEMQKKLEAETADDMAVIDATCSELEALEKEADAEENQGNIADVQNQIQNM